MLSIMPSPNNVVNYVKITEAVELLVKSVHMFAIVAQYLCIYEVVGHMPVVHRQNAFISNCLIVDFNLYHLVL